MKTKGGAALKINDIAATAGLDKKLIYNYFGGTDQLLDEYIQSQDFWSNVQHKDVNLKQTDGGHSFSKAMLLSQFDQVFSNKELQKIMFKNITDPHFGDKATRYRAIMALLVSGIYYLDIYASTNKQTFCGLDISSKEGRREIEEAISFIVDQAYGNTGDK